MIEIPLSKLMCTGAFTIITSSVSLKTYVCPAWIEVPYGTLTSDIKVISDKPQPVRQPVADKEFVIKGSTGKLYTVRLNASGNSCTCAGFGFYRKCKHIQQALKL